jgi:hypothetical protein
MRADLGTLFENADSELAFLFLRQLREANAHGQARRPGADDDHVKIHCFSFHDDSRLVVYEKAAEVYATHDSNAHSESHDIPSTTAVLTNKRHP